MRGRGVVTAAVRRPDDERRSHEHYAPGLNPVDGVWSLQRRGWLFNVAFSTPEHLIRTLRSGLRHIQYRSNLIDGCLIETGLTIRPA